MVKPLIQTMRATVFFATLLVLASVTSAYAKYADVTFTVDTSGVVTTTGIADVHSLPIGVSDNYTSKAKGVWTLNISTPETLDSFVYAVVLPQGATVNYIGGKGARITTVDNTVVIRGSGQDTVLAITAQYSLEAEQKESNSFAWLPLSIALLVLAVLWLALRGMRSRPVKAQTIEKTEQTANAPQYIEGLPDRQREIIKLLRIAGGTLTQRQVELALKLPKSSVSRNVESLRRRGIIEKAQLGMSNTLTLSEKYR